MSLLRIHAPLGTAPERARWVLFDGERGPVSGEGPLANLPRNAGRVQLVIPAPQVLFTRARLPGGLGRQNAATVAFAVEEKIVNEPESSRIFRLGVVAGEDVLAVVDARGLALWGQALEAAGIPAYEIQSEVLMLPRADGEWSLAWDGSEGFVRTGDVEGASTDCGDRVVPPVSLRMLLDEAAVRDARPAAIAVYTTTPDAAPDVAAWSRSLSIPLRIAGAWDWRIAPAESGVSLMRERHQWRGIGRVLARSRPALWIAAAALVFHAVALTVDWAMLAREQQVLRRDLEARFRKAFPDAVAVVDPVLQMRRKLAEARHAVGRPDSGDFLPMMDGVAAGLRDLPAGAVRIVSYESGRLSLEVSAVDAAAASRVATRLQQQGFRVDPPVPSKAAGARVVVIVVRAL